MAALKSRCASAFTLTKAGKKATELREVTLDMFFGQRKRPPEIQSTSSKNEGFIFATASG
jgi:hypothetical protein